MSRARIAAAVTVLVVTLAPFGARATDAVVTDEVTFKVINQMDGNAQYNVHGVMYRPSRAQGCASSVLVLVHGLSYGIYAWDFPLEPETYSVARALAARGYPTVAIDLPGYGNRSTRPPTGYHVTVDIYARMVASVVATLRAGAYTATAPQAFGKVGLVGHSAGTEIAELASSLYTPIDALVATGYTHFPSQRIAQDFFTGDYPRALQSDYEYFGGTPEGRWEYMYADPADRAIMEKDNELARLTPSGQVFSIGAQPSGKVMAKITAPVLLLLAEKDLLFPVEFGDQELALFASAEDKTKMVAPGAGHSFMLHPNAPDTNAQIADWLGARKTAIPAC